jgi:hypothetical protein
MTHRSTVHAYLVARKLKNSALPSAVRFRGRVPGWAAHLVAADKTKNLVHVRRTLLLLHCKGRPLQLEPNEKLLPTLLSVSCELMLNLALAPS